MDRLQPRTLGRTGREGRGKLEHNRTGISGVECYSERDCDGALGPATEKDCLRAMGRLWHEGLGELETKGRTGGKGIARHRRIG